MAPIPVCIKSIITLLLVASITDSTPVLEITDSTPVLEITDSSGAGLFMRIKQNEIFSIKYTHSVEKTPIEELFYINDSHQIVLYGMIYTSLGAGLPSEGYSVINGTFVIKEINETWETIPLRISSIAKHVLIVGSWEIKLWQFFDDGELVEITVDGGRCPGERTHIDTIFPNPNPDIEIFI